MRVFIQSEQYLLREGFVPPQKGVFLWEERIYPKKKLSTLDSGVTLMDLFNPTSERDASHLISIEPKEGCTNHVWYWASLKNCELCMIALPYFFKSRGRWGFPLKPQKAPFCTPSHFRLISVVPSPKGQFSKLQGWLLVKLFLQSKNKFIKSVRKSVRVFT